MNDDPSDIDQGIVVSRMVITRYLDADGNDSIGLETEGDDSLVSRLGALALSIDTLLRGIPTNNEDEDGDDDGGAYSCE